MGNVPLLKPEFTGQLRNCGIVLDKLQLEEWNLEANRANVVMLGNVGLDFIGFWLIKSQWLHV